MSQTSAPVPDAPQAPAGVQVLPWDVFEPLFTRTQKQGEHVSIVGQTGSGKSVLGLSLCKAIGSRAGQDNRPERVVVLGTKPRDDTLASLGWPIIKKWPPAYGEEHCIVWPRGGKADELAVRQRPIFRGILNQIYAEGGQTVCIDEAGYFEDPAPDGLALGTLMKRYWTTARSLKLTLVAGTQRPRHVTRSMWSEPSWVFIFSPDDEDDLRRVAEMSGAREQVLEIAPQLGGYEFLCVRRQRGTDKKLFISKVE